MNTAELIRRAPNLGANVVIQAAKWGGDILNAYEVLEAAVGWEKAQDLIVNHTDPIAGPQLLDDIYTARAVMTDRDY